MNEIVFSRRTDYIGTLSRNMRMLRAILRTANRRIALLAAAVVALDQVTKLLVMKLLPHSGVQEKVIINGFFKFVHWGNTGAAWSMFRGNNDFLALIALVALVILYFSRHHFDIRTKLGQLAFGLISGGIIGNLIDRVRVGHVIDFIYFYIVKQGGEEVGFPAFNIADSAICTGVALVFIITWRNERRHRAADKEAPAAPVNG